jgi:hypothetical protein
MNNIFGAAYIPPTKPLVVAFNQGERMHLLIKATTPDGSAATPDNSDVYFVLKTSTVDGSPVWSAQWNTGVSYNALHAPRVAVHIPDSVSEELKDGDYKFSLSVRTDSGTQHMSHGTLIVRYSAASPNPYVRVDTTIEPRQARNNP